MRDLGGYLNAFEKHVKFKQIFRSDDLTSLTNEDLDYLSNIPLRMVIDFRSTPEVKQAINHLPQTVSQYIKLPIIAGDISLLNAVSLDNPIDLMKSMYANIIRNYQPIFKRFFELLLERKQIPILFHCTAGKDRTGIATALFLSAMNVDRQTIINDYMLSAIFLKNKYASIVERYPELETLLTVKEEYLLEAFRVIDEEFDGDRKSVV